VYENDSGQYQMAGFDMNGVEPSGTYHGAS